jgi:hypothetical protein
MFHLDGTIEVRLSASGYLQGGFWEPSQEGYGAPIQETSSTLCLLMLFVSRLTIFLKWDHFMTM